MPSIPDATIDEVRAASDLVDVVSDRVRLKKQGKNYMGLCPFHNEKSPSFSVDAAQNLYYCFGCLDEDEPVWTDRGLIRIGDVEVGDSVLGIDGAEERVADVWTKRRPVRELSLGAVRRDPLRLTGDHVCVVVPEADAVHTVPMLYRQSDRGVRFQSRKRAYRTPRPSQTVQRLASDVEAGDYVLFPVVPAWDRRDAPLAAPLHPQVAPVSPPASMGFPDGPAVAWPRRKGPAPRTVEALPVTERTARLFGLWLAEGSVYRGGVRWSFHRDEEAYAQFVVDVLQTELGLPATVHRRPEQTLTEVTCSSTHLSRLLPLYFGKGAAGKRVPWQALRWSPAVQRAFVEGYLDGDGTRPGNGMATALSVSESLVRGMFAVAVQAGYVVSMGREGYVTSAGRALWRLAVRSRESADAFYHPADGQRAYWLRVSANRPVEGDRVVVDIETTGSHTFTTKLGAVHNCRRGGDVFKFIQEIEGVGFLDSVRLLADRAGIEVQEAGADNPEADRRATLTAALRFAAGYYYRTLGTPAGERGLTYVKGRGFSPEAVREFGIGVAPAGWDGLVTAAVEAGYKPEVLEAVGLAKERQGGGHYDVFRDRLMFPILSPIGKVLGFGGRILPDTQTGSADYTPAKYVNSPETEVYRKGRVLYGMKQSKRAIRTEREAVVVEGYADVVSLWDAGVRNVVAASGTALGPEQMALLKKLDVQRLVLLFDADEAGQSAARKGVDAALDAGLAPYAVTLPDGADPDSFVRQFGADAFRAVLRDERTDFVAFLVAQARQSGALATPEGKAETVRAVLRTIKRLGDPIQTGEYLRRAAGLLDVYETDLRREFEGQRAARPRAERPDPEAPAEPPRPPAPEADIHPEEVILLRLMLAHGVPMVEHVLTRMGVEEFTAGAARDVVLGIVAQFEEGAVSAEPFTSGRFGEAARVLVQEALFERHSLSIDNWKAKTGTAVKGRDSEPFAAATSAMRLLKLDRVQEALTEAMGQIQARERAGQDIADLQARVNELNAHRRQIDRGEFMEWGA